MFSTIRPTCRACLFTILGALLLAFGACSCSRRAMTDEEASLWIAAYSPAIVDQEARIRLEFTDMMLEHADTSRALDHVFSFSPSLKGHARYSDDARYVTFTPDEAMEPGRRYTCRVKMHELAAIDTLPDFVFDFCVDKRQVRFEDVEVKVDPDNQHCLRVEGCLVYNAEAGDSITAMKAFLDCDYQGAEIEMDEEAAKRTRRFAITGIKRKDKGQVINIATNALGGFAPASYSITVPSTAEFTLLHAERVEAAEPYINLEFSMPLSTQQEPDGLISIDNVENTRIVREGANAKIYYGRNAMPDLTLRVSELLKDVNGDALGTDIEKHFAQEVIAPAIELPFEGCILPDNRNLKLPFRAVNLAAVDVEVVKIFPSNVMTFLQEYDLDETASQRRFGRLIYRKTVRLDKDPDLNLHQWQDFSIDLKGLFAKERGAVYNIRLLFRKAYSLYGKSHADNFDLADGITAKDKKKWDEPYPYIYRSAPDFDYSKYKWNETSNPASDSYYMEEWNRMPEVNLVASDLGLIAKQAGDGETKVVVTNLVTALPAAGAVVKAYSYQMQPLGSAVTNAAGFATLRTDGAPFMLTASDGASTTYLKVTPGRELSTSNFDVDGKQITDGIKGFVYGDRGVWRPGDDVHLTLIVEDADHRLPANHPVVMEVYNPDEQLYERQTLTRGVDGFYAFSIHTDESARTGLWRAQFKVGNQTFHHPVRIETIKPNRLKINIKTPKIIQAGEANDLGLQAHWLTGPVASGMTSVMEMTLYPNPTPFESYKGYTFKNPLVTYESSTHQLCAGDLDSLGRLSRPCTVAADINSPGMLQANITARVTEPGGDASIATTSVPFSPFGVYVGINLGRKEFVTDTLISFPVVALNQLGRKMRSRQLEYKIYRLDWSWWYEGNADDLNRYVKSTTADLVKSGTVTVADGRGSIPFKVEYPDWGRYLVLVRDTKGGHATGGIVSVDWPEWRGRSSEQGAEGSTELSFNLDKAQYEAGETAYVYLPKCEGGRVLISVENGSGVLKSIWAPLSGKSETKFPLPVDRSMAPNFYVSATMLRPHRATDFDTPLRLFGVQGAKVIDRQSILHPEIDMPDALHPSQPFTVRVSEKNRWPMTYTLAIVDEGLLDVTNFKTPRPWAAMNQKEALGVRTWDMFDDVIGAFGANFRSILSVGGDEALRKAAGKEKRFRPVVMFLGPFTTQGAPKTHKIMMPNYVGSVRVMVVAAHQGAYGNADKTVKVTSPLMLLSTLPRTLANCDTVDMPVNIFAMQQGLGQVEVSIATTGPVKAIGQQRISKTFSAPGEQLARFRLACDKEKEGTARIIVTATAQGHTATDTTFITVANPMPMVVETVQKTIAAGASAEFAWPSSASGTAGLQLASIPMPSFGGAWLFLENYQHLCSEQLASKALFALYGRRFLDADARARCEKELPRLIKAVQARQIANGGFAYWPGQDKENEWVSSMAGIALAEAVRQGFTVDADCLSRWFRYQAAKARDYRHSLATDLTQALRLWSMAIAGEPQTSAMNRLRESASISRSAAFCLACAYAQTGRHDVAIILIEKAGAIPASESADMFGSEARDQAIELSAYAMCSMPAKALAAARNVASDCTGRMFVTQDLAFASMAFSQLAALVGSSQLDVKVTEPGKTPLLITELASLREIALNPSAGKSTVQNLSAEGSIEATLLTAHRPLASETVGAQSNGLKMSIVYTDLSGQPISVNNLKQDTELRAVVTVTNLGEDVDNMALTLPIPSGWEIWNDRLLGASGCDNRDIRDSSVRFYFGLKRGATRRIEVRLRAAYAGHYLLPPAVCEDMYNPACRAISASRRVTVSL